LAALYADENYPLPTVLDLRAAGHDVLTAAEDGRTNQQIPDPDVLARAASLGRAVLTNNRKHFVRLHRFNPGHAGIVVCSEDLDFSALAARVHAAVSSVPTLIGQLIRVNKPNLPRVP
jgi:hypothetical protein